jgi:GT2 family glycosyltransferase
MEFMQKEFPDIRTIQLDKNYGFAEGYNRALAQVEAEYYVLLNSDIEVTPGWIDPVVKMMDADPDIAAAQPKLRAYHEKEMFEYAGAAGGYIDKFGYPFCRGRLFQEIEKDEGQYDDAVEVFWATGACMFVRASVYNEMGGLDNDFFAHMEEIDYCWRLKNNGYKIMYCPDSIVYHIGGGTLPKKNSTKTYLNIRNNIIMLYKNLQSHRLIRVYLLRVMLDSVASIKFFIDGGFSDLFAVIRAHFHFIFHFGKYRKKRRSLIQSRVGNIYWGSVVKAHYADKKTKFTDLDPEKFKLPS